MIKNRSVAAFGVALVILVAISADAYRNLLVFIRNSEQVEHTLKVQNRLEALLSYIKDAETGQRGYLLTGDKRYLDPFNAALKAVKPEIKSLRQLLASNSTQKNRLDAVESLTEAKLTELQTTIDLRKNQKLDLALQLVQTNRGKRVMDELRQLVLQMKTEEERLLQQHSAATQASARSTTFVIVAGSILTAVVVALAMLTLNRDITKRHQVEEQLRKLNEELEQRVSDRTQALEATNRAKDEFLSVLSHELRTPLNAMLGWSKLLRSGTLNPTKTAQALEVIERNARSQAQLIEDILDISRIITGKLRLNVCPVQPINVIEAAIDTVRPAADARSIRIQAILDPLAGPISGDPDRLQQVVWNLLSNAIKFTPKRGKVQVRLERVNSHIEITISDTGQGISPEFLPYVFNRFTQADGSTTRAHGGLGLGLAIVRHIVELHGGTVSAESLGEAQGSTFMINLPLAIAYQRTNDPERVHPALSGDGVPFEKTPSLVDLHILVVDDEADARELLVTVLEQCGAKVTAVASASEAIEAIESLQPHVLVSDIGMPDEDGYALIRQVRALNEGSGMIPAIALTAYARTEDRIRTLSAGFQMHIPKPVEPSELIVAIMSLAGRMRNN